VVINTAYISQNFKWIMRLKKIHGLPQWLLAIVCSALIVALWLIVSFVIKFGLIPSDAQESWGQFGDFVGGILNPLFSIIGLLALLHTIVLQSKELSRSTKELKSSAKALERQNRHNARQQFDNNFFQLMALNISQSNTIQYGYGSTKTIGEAAFQSAFNDFSHGWSMNAASGNEWIEKFDYWYGNSGIGFSTYTHSLTNMVDFVYEAKVPRKAKNFAYSTISANLSSDVAVIYFFMFVFSDDHNWFSENSDSLICVRFYG
jgi:hypothetical protein